MQINNPYNSYGNPEERAKSLLCHYIQVAMGEPLNADCVSEIGDIIDCILEAVKQTTPEYQIRQLQQQIAWLKSAQKVQLTYLEQAQAALQNGEDRKQQQSLAEEIETYLHD
jgi:hypothetical protein